MSIVKHPAAERAELLRPSSQACATAEVLIEIAVMGTPDHAARVEHYDRLLATLMQWRPYVELAREEVRP